MVNKIENEFKIMHSKLRQLEQIYNSREKNLHFNSLEKADAELYSHLLELAQEGLEKVHKHFDYFSKHSLYDDGMFWYDLFLVISAAALRIKANRDQQDIPENIVKELTVLLVDISEFSSLYPSDIQKRNHEALGNTLYGFYSKDLLALARKRSRESGLKKISEFVEWTIDRVEEMV